VLTRLDAGSLLCGSLIYSWKYRTGDSLWQDILLAKIICPNIRCYGYSGHSKIFDRKRVLFRLMALMQGRIGHFSGAVKTQEAALSSMRKMMPNSPVRSNRKLLRSLKIKFRNTNRQHRNNKRQVGISGLPFIMRGNLYLSVEVYYTQICQIISIIAVIFVDSNHCF
jgi:hypothetical protein